MDSIVKLNPLHVLLHVNDHKWKKVQPGDFLDLIDEKYFLPAPEESAFGSDFILAADATKIVDSFEWFTGPWKRSGLQQLRKLADGLEHKSPEKITLKMDKLMAVEAEEGERQESLLPTSSSNTLNTARQGRAFRHQTDGRPRPPGLTRTQLFARLTPRPASYVSSGSSETSGTSDEIVIEEEEDDPFYLDRDQEEIDEYYEEEEEGGEGQAEAEEGQEEDEFEVESPEVEFGDENEILEDMPSTGDITIELENIMPRTPPTL